MLLMLLMVLMDLTRSFYLLCSLSHMQTRQVVQVVSFTGPISESSVIKIKKTSHRWRE